MMLSVMTKLSIRKVENAEVSYNDSPYEDALRLLLLAIVLPTATTFTADF